MQVDRRDLRQLTRPEHAVDEVPQPIGFFDDDLRVIAQALALEFAFEQLSRITSYNVCYTKLLRFRVECALLLV